MDKTFILGVPITVATPNELSKAIRRLLYRRRGHIVTPNPEFLLLAQKHQEFFSVLENADLSIPDGIGLKFAGWLKGVNLHRYTGSNLVKYLLDIANQKRGRVAIANWRNGLSTNEEIVEAIKKRHPHLKTYVFSLDRENFNYDIKRLKAFQPDIVFVALGAPSQDIFIRSRLLKELPQIRLAMGVGGSFDFLTGKLKRAPLLIQFLGFEWLWRLIKQPWRIKRIYNAVIIFPLAVIEWEIRRFRYRKNVAAFIVNKNNEVLLLNPIRSQAHYWSIPQGGVEKNESIEMAVRREIKEETGLSEFTILSAHRNIYKFDWPKYYTMHGFRGQRQSLFIIKYDGKPSSVKTNRFEHRRYRWVKLDCLLQIVSRTRREQYELFLKKYYESIGK